MPVRRAAFPPRGYGIQGPAPNLGSPPASLPASTFYSLPPSPKDAAVSARATPNDPWLRVSAWRSYVIPPSEGHQPG